ncbi:hypothetical protein ABID59_004230 [Bradyrhizobium sp. S3.3.6]
MPDDINVHLDHEDPALHTIYDMQTESRVMRRFVRDAIANESELCDTSIHE